jgi:hypothetical protein
MPVLFLGCASGYFRPAGVPPLPPPRYTLADWPYQEHWAGMVFNGVKVGFTHLSISPAEDAAKGFDIRSRASLRFHFLMVDKSVILESHDRVADDLSIKHFESNYNLDGNRQKLTGKLKDGRLDVEIVNKGQSSRVSIPFEGKLYPTSIIGLYPVLHGLELGRHYSYQVYDGETQTIATVTQEVLAYEESELFPGKAFRIKTRLHEQVSTTWIDARGYPLLEMALGGVLIANLESENRAKHYLTQAAVNKDDVLLNFSLIRSDTDIMEPERVKFMEVALSGVGAGLGLPEDEIQQCQREGQELFCQIKTQGLDEDKNPDTGDPDEIKRYLQPSHIVPSNNDLIRKTARDIAADSETTTEKLSVLVEWLQENIEKKPVDVFTALDVLSGKMAECQGHSFLFAAFARALDIPTRVVNGIVYSRGHQGFLYHTWAESQVNGHWVAVDPTFGQMPADATHIKLVEGEKPSDLMPLVELIGRLQVRIIFMEGS